jgi:hypothetical protein
LSGLNIFFDVDYTILAVDGSLRPNTHEVFERLAADGHRIYIWSGMGVRTAEVRRHGLEGHVVDVFEKPLHDYEARLSLFNVNITPEFVIDDYPEIVGVFGGVVVRPYYFPVAGDDEMERVYRIADEFSKTGRSDDGAFRLRNGGQPEE